MKASSVVAPLATSVLLWAGTALAQSYTTIPTIEVYGQHFFYTNNGSQFYMKGVAYQQNYQANGTGSTSGNNAYTDPLADGSSCSRDIPYMKQIFTNVIRVYALDPTQSHDDCMTQLADADIYVVADLSAPGESIESNDPDWDVGLYERYTSVVDAMAKYNNVIGFFAGNEVVSSNNQTAAAAFVKAAVRDTKAYIKSQGHRSTLGVGYATADVPSRDDLAAYFACGDSSVSIDFWGYNVYSWCGDSNYAESSYGERVQFFSDYPVPVFFAEYGCIEGVTGGPTHRPFTEVQALYGDEMTPVFSGGIVYEWFMGANDYGLVSIDGNSVSPYPDFTSLSSQLANVTPSTTMSSAYSPTNSAPACPTVGPSGSAVDDLTWAAQATPLPPSVNPQLCACEAAAYSCVITDNNANDYGDVFGYICGAQPNACNGFAHNATSGQYGALAGCSPKQQLGWAANQYYLAHSKSASACDFSGVAATQAPKTSAGCASLLSAAGSAGTGSVASPTGAGTAFASGGSGSSSSSGAARPGAGVPPSFFDFGKLYMGVYAILTAVSAVGMLTL